MDCLTVQTVLPDKILLYLSEMQFEGRMLPEELHQFEKYGFEVCWKKEDLGSHKKYFYVIQEYPDDIVITIDDDFYYKQTLIEELLEGYKKFPEAIIARRAAIVTCSQNGDIAPYSKWCGNLIMPDNYVNVPRMDIFATTGGGTLFPPQLLKREIFSKDIIIKHCRYADDIWIKIMQLINNVPTVLVNAVFDDVPMEEYRGSGLFAEHNGNGGNDAQLSALLKIYDEYHGVGNKLTDQLFAGGKLYASRVEEVFRMTIQKKVNDFIKSTLDYERIVIYGAGIVGKRVCEALRKAGMYEKIEAFVVSDTENNPNCLLGYFVKDYRDYVDKKKMGIIIGILPQRQKDIISNLIQTGINEKRIIGLDEKTNIALQQFVMLEDLK